MTIMRPNHADEVYTQKTFWSKLVKDYVAISHLPGFDPDYLAKIQKTAKEWEDKWGDYLKHLEYLKYGRS